MEGNLVIVESPAKAKTIQKYLGEGFTVKSSFGHIRDLQDTKLSVDVEHDFKPEYVISSDKKKLVAELKKASSQANIVWLASDEDREGEAIAWHLSETLGLDKARTRRIVFHEITKPAILHAIETPRDIDLNLVDAQQARRVLDRLVGFELSPVLWRKIQRGLSAGRVQSVALRLITDREKEIMAFQNTAFYKIKAQMLTQGTTVKASLDSDFKDISEARKFLSDSIGANYSIGNVEKKEAVRHPAPPFTTSTLQQEAARKLRFPVSLTMRLAQGLYERGLITYMRTDSTNLSSLALGTSKEFIINTFGAQYSHPRQYKTHSKGAQEAHEAIRPTFASHTTIEGTAQEQKLYELIWKRTLASQMEDARVLNTNVKVDSDHRPEKFCFQASEILFDGFLKLYIEGTDDLSAEDGQNAILPELHIGDSVSAEEITAECKFTQAPARYSEATLVKKLEELGIGRPSTYAPTITTLTTERGYLVKGDKEGRKIEVLNLSLKGSVIKEIKKTETIGGEKGRLLPQEIGMIVSDYLVENFPQIMDYDFTANVEKDFDSIAEGKIVWNSVIKNFYGDFHQKVSETLENKQFNHIERELGVDPVSGLKLVAKFGQFGPYVQKGEDEGKTYAKLAKGQLIETITLQQALELFKFPRNLGEYEGLPILVQTGRFGPYIKHGDKNTSLPRGTDPLAVDLEECITILKAAEQKQNVPPIKEFSESDITVIAGRFGPYIKHGGSNYKIPKSVTDASTLSEEDCKKIIEETTPSVKGRKARYSKKK